MSWVKLRLERPSYQVRQLDPLRYDYAQFLDLNEQLERLPSHCEYLALALGHTELVVLDDDKELLQRIALAMAKTRVPLS